jgi:hypothetical protein
MKLRRLPSALLFGLALGSSGCFGQSTTLPVDGGSAEDDAAPEDMMDGATRDAESGEPDTGTADTGTADTGVQDGGSGPGLTRSTRIDLLFVVDNSGSMREEQAALRDQLPVLVEALTTGMRDGQRFAEPVADLHMGIVSVDMGLLDVQDIAGCTAFGDDGVLQHVATSEVAGCEPSYPSFISWGAGDDAAQVATDFGCIAYLGTTGCGFEQQLEAPLKALWPSNDSSITFLGLAGGTTKGHGDAANAGFLRNDASTPSLIVVVMLTDEEDCSSSTTRHFTPQKFLDPSDPLYTQDLNLRCFYNKLNLYPVSRYVEGLRKLRPGNEGLVLFSAIVGVPPDLVDAAALAAVDFSDAANRNAYYDQMLADPRMIEVPEPGRPPGQGILSPSCVRANMDGTPALAYPPRRIVETVKGFGENGRVQSICQDDLSVAVDAILELMAPHLGD